MKFKIDRASSFIDPKVEGAILEKVTRIDYRTVSTLEEARKSRWGKEWFGGGSNHREEKGMVARDIEDTIYTIEIGSLEDLLEFIGKEEAIVIDLADYKEVKAKILIYDDYLG